MLTGEANKEYQRDYMRRRRGSNAGLTGSNNGSNKAKHDAGSNAGLTERSNADVRPTIPGLIMKGNQIIGVAEEVKGNKPIFPEPVILPLYNPAVHKAGDKVLIRQGKRLVEMVVPEMDVDGNLIP